MSQQIHNTKNIVENALKNSKLLKQGIVKGNWEKIVGKDLGRKTYVSEIRNGVLIINTENPVMLHQLSFLKENIKSSVNDFLGIDYIIDIQYKVRKRNIEDIFENEGEEEEFDPKKIKLDNAYNKFIEEEVSVIENEEIKNRIKKLMEISKKKEKYLLQEGNKKCVYCGIIFSGNGNICINCLNEERKEKISKIFEKIKENPFIDYEMTKKFLLDIKEEEFLSIREKVKERVKILMYKEINDDNEEGFKYYARIFYKLETGIRDNGEIERLVNFQLLKFD